MTYLNILYISSTFVIIDIYKYYQYNFHLQFLSASHKDSKHFAIFSFQSLSHKDRTQSFSRAVAPAAFLRRRRRRRNDDVARTDWLVGYLPLSLFEKTAHELAS